MPSNMNLLAITRAVPGIHSVALIGKWGSLGGVGKISMGMDGRLNFWKGTKRK